jgi:hypothetical protein
MRLGGTTSGPKGSCQHRLRSLRWDGLRFAVLTMCLLVSWSAHAQRTIGELFTVCEDYERGARQNVDSVSLPNINAGVCHGYFQAVGHLAHFYTVEPKGQSVKRLMRPQGR